MAVFTLPADQSQIVVLPSAARTADVTTDTFVVGRARGLVVVINATALSATPSVVFNIRGVDPASGTVWTILTSAAVTTAAPTQVVLRIHPELTASANLIAKDLCPPAFNVFADHGDADSLTYSVGAHITL